MKSLDPRYLEGYAILQLVLRNYRGAVAFNKYMGGLNRSLTRTILDVDVEDYHIKVTFDGRYGRMELICPFPLFNAVTSNEGDGWYVVDLKDVRLDQLRDKK